MRSCFALFFLIFLAACTHAKDRTYTGSTPAGKEVRSFLGIPLNDSIDFIRWKVTFNDRKYQLECNYGIGKPNTNGFINGGKTVKLNGVVERGNNYYLLKNGNTSLQIAELNNNLLHLANANKELFVGNGGWSYLLNNTSATGSNDFLLKTKRSSLEDSVIYEGRTPCGVPGVVAAGTQCYKLKWKIILYGNPEKNEPQRFKVYGTVWRNIPVPEGKWTITTMNDGRIIYNLAYEKGHVTLHLIKADENILLFADAAGNLLTGNEDFSYALNRK